MKKIILAPLAVAILATTVQAANNDSVEVPLSGRVILPLEVSLTNSGIVMPDVASPQVSDTATAATVTLSCNSDGTSSVSYDGESNPFANGVAAAAPVSTSSANVTNSVGNSTGTCAELAVTGEAGYYYTSSMLSAPGGASGLAALGSALIECNSDLSTNGVIGTDGLYCGATVTILATGALGQAGVYDSSLIGDNGVVAVVYD